MNYWRASVCDECKYKDLLSREYPCCECDGGVEFEPLEEMGTIATVDAAAVPAGLSMKELGDILVHIDDYCGTCSIENLLKVYHYIQYLEDGEPHENN